MYYLKISKITVTGWALDDLEHTNPEMTEFQLFFHFDDNTKQEVYYSVVSHTWRFRKFYEKVNNEKWELMINSQSVFSSFLLEEYKKNRFLMLNFPTFHSLFKKNLNKPIVASNLTRPIEGTSKLFYNTRLENTQQNSKSNEVSKSWKSNNILPE